MKLADLLTAFAARETFTVLDVREFFKAKSDHASKAIKYGRLAGVIEEVSCDGPRNRGGAAKYRIIPEAERSTEHCKSVSSADIRARFLDSSGFTVDDLGERSHRERELNRTQLYLLARQGEIVKIGERPSVRKGLVSVFVFKHNQQEANNYPPELDILFNQFIGGGVQHHPQGRVYSFA